MSGKQAEKRMENTGYGLPVPDGYASQGSLQNSAGRVVLGVVVIPLPFPLCKGVHTLETKGSSSQLELKSWGKNGELI